MKYLFFTLMCISTYAQISSSTEKNNAIIIDNGKKDSVKIFKPTIDDYKFKTENTTPKNIDTTFTERHSYVYTQYNNQDNFGKIQFNNIGAGFQDLVFHMDRQQQHFQLVPTNKSHFLIDIDKVKYYDVKTPTTSFLYHTAMKNGFALNTTYTQNFGKNLNLAVEYMGLKSQGFYTNNLSQSDNVIFSGHYTSPNKRYQAYAHYLHQNVNNEENGGITALALFQSGDDRFNNRENIPVRFQDSDSRFGYRRYYLYHSFLPFNSEKFPFKVAHQMYYQLNKYYFNFGMGDTASFTDYDNNISNGTKKYSYNFSNTFSLIFDKPKFYLDAGLRHQNIHIGNNWHYTNILQNNENSEHRIGAVGKLRINLWDKVNLNSFLEYSNGKFLGNFLKTENRLRLEPIKNYFLDANLNWQSAAPNLNLLSNYSPIERYNWGGNAFKNENIMEIGGSMGLKWFNSQVFIKYFRVDNFAFINANEQFEQAKNSLNISQIGGEATFDYHKFHLNTRLHFQTNISENNLFPTPKFIGRINFYYKTPAFKKASEIIAGIKVYYFTKFASREFSPILNEFILPSVGNHKIGGQPIVDAYFNMKVKRMQFYVEAQNSTTLFLQNRSYTAPNYPLYDFRLNIGILWHLFN